MRASIASTVSAGLEIRPAGAGTELFTRPAMNSSRGAPLQLARPTAPANWTLKTCLVKTYEKWQTDSHVQVTKGDTALDSDGPVQLNDLVETTVGGLGALNIPVRHDRAVYASVSTGVGHEQEECDVPAPPPLKASDIGEYWQHSMR